MSLDGVLDRYRSMNDLDTRVFARENPTGAREFVIMSLDQAWQETASSKPSHLYEVLAGPCEVYLDIEWKCKSKPDDEKSVVQEVVRCTEEKLKKLYSVNVSSCLATASGLTSEGLYKCSWHVNFKTPGIMWASAKHVGDFVKCNLNSFACVDFMPYNAPKQNWRCVGSSKCSDPARVLQPISKKNFLKCIVQQDHAGAQIVGCREPLPVPVQITGTAKQVLRQFENTRCDAAHFSVQTDRYLIVPFMSQVCPIANRKHNSNHQYAVVDLKCMRWKHCCHNMVCQQKPQIWRPMPNFNDAKRLLPPCAPVNVPELVDESFNVTPSVVVRARGPPPSSAFSASIVYVQCSNGIYHLPRAL